MTRRELNLVTLGTIAILLVVLVAGFVLRQQLARMDSAIESSNENQIADTATSSSEDSTEYEHKQCEYGEF